MNRSLYVRGTMVEDGQVRELVIADGTVADATPMASREPDAVGWVLPGLADVHNHLSLASPAGDHEEPAIRVRLARRPSWPLACLRSGNLVHQMTPPSCSPMSPGGRGWLRLAGSSPRRTDTFPAWRER